MSGELIAPGRVAVVTGAASGIGLALAKRFAAEGMNVVVADIDAQRLSAAAGEIAASGDAEVLDVSTDVSSAESVQSLADAAFERFGAVHVLCNNAGVGPPPRTLWKIELEDWRWALDIDLYGPIHGMKAFLPRMIESGEPGHVVNTSSISGLLPLAPIGPYSVAKSAVVALSQVQRQALAQQQLPIGVSVLCPGDVATGLQDNSDRLRPAGPGWREPPKQPDEMTPEQIADVVAVAIAEQRFWVLPHTRFVEELEQSMADLIDGARWWTR